MLSICTPTFNREYTLSRLYISLKKQSDMNFEWVIIDDGSEDDTEKLIRKFKNENIINISYFKQSNAGKHVALNKAYEIAKYNHILCLDSDDWLLEDAVESINKDYIDILEKNDRLAGLAYTDIFEDGSIIGSELPNNKELNWIDLRHKNKMKGDKCYTFKKNILLEYPFITYPNNNHMPPTYQFYLLSAKYNIFTINKPLKIVEYLDDGISKNIRRKYYSSAENYAYYRKAIHELLPTFTSKIKNIILYNISYYNSKKYNELKFKNAQSKILSFALYPFSLLISNYYKRWKI